MEINELVELLNRVYDLHFQANIDGSISYKAATYAETKEFTIKAEDVVSLISHNDCLDTSPVRINSLLYNEILLRDDTGMPYRSRDVRRYDDKDNHIKYEYASPSLRMCLAIIKYADKTNPDLVKELRSRTRRVLMFRYEDNSMWIFNAVVSPRYSSLTILPEDGYTLEKVDCVTLCTSFSFSYAYNLGRVIYTTDNVEDLFDLSRTRRLRRGRSDYMEAPKKKYIPELVNFYLRAANGESSDYQYLSYYHILEYFFEKVYLDNVILQIRRELTHPSFSYKRDSDIKGFYGKIKKIVRDASVQSGLNELESLKLTLKKYVPDLQRVKEGIESVSKDVLDFLKSNAGPFSKHMVNFDSVDIELIYTNIANRIYANRNAIAHSKESDSREKFIPYKHDNDLLNEVLLIRIVAEEVIINSSKGL